MDWPLIYCNGDSYSDATYFTGLRDRTYAHHVGRSLNGFVVNKSISGSCNRRIIRTTLSDMLKETRANPQQPKIVLMGLSFEIRSELWYDETANTLPPEESQFRTHAFSVQLDWRSNLLNNKDIGSVNTQGAEHRFFQRYSEGRAFFYSPYAERINLLCDLIMLRDFFDRHNIRFLVFQHPRADALQSDHLLDQFRDELSNDARFIDFEKFGFCDWCHDQGFTPLDYHDRPTIAHYGADAHEGFAEKILLPRLKETGQI